MTAFCIICVKYYCQHRLVKCEELTFLANMLGFPQAKTSQFEICRVCCGMVHRIFKMIIALKETFKCVFNKEIHNIIPLNKTTFLNTNVNRVILLQHHSINEPEKQSDPKNVMELSGESTDDAPESLATVKKIKLLRLKKRHKKKARKLKKKYNIKPCSVVLTKLNIPLNARFKILCKAPTKTIKQSEHSEKNTEAIIDVDQYESDSETAIKDAPLPVLQPNINLTENHNLISNNQDSNNLNWPKDIISPCSLATGAEAVSESGLMIDSVSKNNFTMEADSRILADYLTTQTDADPQNVLVTQKEAKSLIGTIRVNPLLGVFDAEKSILPIISETVRPVFKTYTAKVNQTTEHFMQIDSRNSVPTVTPMVAPNEAVPTPGFARLLQVVDSSGNQANPMTKEVPTQPDNLQLITAMDEHVKVAFSEHGRPIGLLIPVTLNNQVQNKSPTRNIKIIMDKTKQGIASTNTQGRTVLATSTIQSKMGPKRRGRKSAFVAALTKKRYGSNIGPALTLTKGRKILTSGTIIDLASDDENIEENKDENKDGNKDENKDGNEDENKDGNEEKNKDENKSKSDRIEGGEQIVEDIEAKIDATISETSFCRIENAFTFADVNKKLRPEEALLNGSAKTQPTSEWQDAFLAATKSGVLEKDKLNQRPEDNSV